MSGINWEYVEERIRRYNALPCDASIKHDDLLYRIGSHVDALTAEDCEFINQGGQGHLNPEQRYQVLNWIASCTKLFDDTDIDLSLLIFGRNQLEQWLERSRQAYPDFEFFLVFEYQDCKKTGWESGINRTIFWAPLPGSPMPATDNDFPWKSFWDSGELFWNDFPGGFTNEFDFTLDCYPDQASFTEPGWVCEEGDRYTAFDERDADLMSVAQVLEHFAVPA